MKHWQIKAKYGGIMAMCILLCTGCSPSDSGDNGHQTENKGNETGFILTGPGSYDSADTAIVTDINLLENKISFYNTEVDKTYTLTFDGTATLYDKYGQALSAKQLAEGDIADITFLKSKKQLNSLQLSPESWSHETAEKYEINTVRKDVTLGDKTYKITSDTKIFSGGQRVEMMDLNNVDILTFRGMGTTVYSIVVEKGHGYLRLENDENFLGGWIEVGQSQIRQIAEDMLLVVPEGRYDVQISHKGGGGTKDVIINRDEEVVLNIGDLEVAEVQYGDVLFALSPSSATVYINGKKVDTSNPVNLQYGIYQLIVKAAGYDSITTYLKVAQPSGGVEIELEKENSSVSSGDSSAGGASTATGYYKVNVDAPEGAEVYLDGNYVGIAPVSFKKSAGAHVVTLRKTGCETRSYTVNIDSEQKDISYSFGELAASGE